MSAHQTRGHDARAAAAGGMMPAHRTPVAASFLRGAWSAEEDALLTSMWNAGYPMRSIREHINRPVNSVNWRRARVLKLAPREAFHVPPEDTGAVRRKRTWAKTGPKIEVKPRAMTFARPCICCGVPFPSEGAHNRMCGDCR